MGTEYRVVGVPKGGVDPGTNEVKFDLQVGSGKMFSFVSKYGELTQIIGALGHMHAQLRDYLAAQNAMGTTAAEAIHAHRIQKERWSDAVIMQLTTPVGVPYTFAMPSRVAAEIADRLKTESAKPTQTGHA